jgi:hypothetical protein
MFYYSSHCGNYPDEACVDGVLNVIDAIQLSSSPTFKGNH